MNLSTRHFLPFVEDVTWDEYYDMADNELKAKLDEIWYYHRTDLQTGIITSKCFLVEGNDESYCYASGEHYNGPYTEEDFQNRNFWGYIDTSEYILDSSKVCYTYID